MSLRSKMNKLDYNIICRNKGFVYLTENKRLVYLIDESGFIHKSNKQRLNAHWKHNMQSVIKEDAKNYFISTVILKHPDILEKTDFGGFKYVSSTEYATVRCRVHGSYKTKPNWILSNGHHCQECGRIATGRSNTKSTEYFIRQARKVHGSRYDYGKTEYNGSNKVVSVTCQKHGVFEIVADYHTQGCGCQICGAEGGGTSREGYILSCTNGAFTYVMKIESKDESFIKVGISKEPIRRLKEIEKESKYKANLIHTEFYEDAGVAWDVEKLLHKDFKEESYTPVNKFGGSTECFDISIQDEVIKILKTLA